MFKLILRPSSLSAFGFAASLCASGCGDNKTGVEGDEASGDSSGADTNADETDGSDAGDGADGADGGKEDVGEGGVAGLELMPALAGLWTGPVSMTPLGSFPTMNMDTRFVDGQVTFSRVDLDAENSLRFEFLVETIAGTDTLVYRNGGYFLGILRDTRTVLVEHEGVAGEGAADYRFCAIDGGCDYIDAHWEFSDADHMILDVKVKGMEHVFWLAERVQTRPVPDGVPEDLESQGMGDAPFPELPSLKATVTWMDELADPADAWVIVSKEDCGFFELCDFSRSLLTTVEAGTTEAVLVLDQMHPGDYKISAFLDRDQNLGATLFPGSGDGVSIPNMPFTVDAEGETEVQVPIFTDL